MRERKKRFIESSIACTSHRVKSAMQIAAAALLLASCMSAGAQAVQFLPTINPVAGDKTAGNSGNGGNALSAQINPTTDNEFAYDAQGDLYFADTANNVIRRVDAMTGVISVFAGGATTVCSGANADANGSVTPAVVVGDGCPATQAILNAPQAITFYKGDLYIGDSGDNFVRVVSAATGIITAYAGNGKATNATAANNGKDKLSLAVHNPVALAFDATGNLYVATTGVGAILRIDNATKTVTIFAGNALNSANKSGDGGLATAAQLRTTNGLATDPQGNLYISEQGFNDVRKVTLANPISNSIISTYVGIQGTSTTAGYSGDGGPATSAMLSSPYGIAIDGSGNLFIADGANNCIREVLGPKTGPNAGNIYTIAGGATAGSSGDGGPAVNALLTGPRGVALTPAGDLVILDTGNAEVRAITPPGNFPATTVGSSVQQTFYLQINTSITVGSFGIAGATTDFAAGTPAGCAAGSLVPAGSTCTITVTFQPSASGARTAALVLQDASSHSYTQPLVGIGVAPAAALLPGTISTISGTSTAGSAGDGGPALSAQLHTPAGVAIDGAGNIFFADTANNEVREIVKGSGSVIRIAGTGSAGYSGDGSAATAAALKAPASVAVDGADNVYIADTGNHAVRLVSGATGVISTLAGTGVSGYSGDGGSPASAQLSSPAGVAMSNAGVLYVADTGNNVVRAIGLRDNLITTLAGTGIGAFAGDGAEAALAQLNAPAAVSVDASNNIYIADTSNNRVRKISAGVISTIAGTGSSGFSGDGAATSVSLNSPVGLAVDAAGNVYIADQANNLIRILASGKLTSVAGTGTAGYSGDAGSSNLATLRSPMGIAIAPTGDLVIGDSGNNVLRRISVGASVAAYPNTSPNNTTSPVTFNLYNSGMQALAVSSVTVPNGFVEQPSGAVDCNGSSVSLTAGSSCALWLAFNPPAIGTYSGNVVITDNAQGNSLSTQTIAALAIGSSVFTPSVTIASSVTAGVATSVTITVASPSATYLGTMHFTSSDPNAVLPADYTFTTADAGKHTFTNVQFQTGGIQTIRVTDTSDSSISAAGSTTVVSGSAASIAIVAGSPQSANINSVFGTTLTVQVKDRFGNPVQGVAVTFTAPTAAGARASFGAAATATVSTNLNGVAIAPNLTADGVTGSYTVAAAAAGVANQVQFQLTNTSSVAAGFVLTASNYNVPVTTGTSATITLTITPVGGFNSPVALTCTDSNPTTTCTPNPATVNPNGDGTPFTGSLTYSTTGPSFTAENRVPTRGRLLTFAALIGFGFLFRRRRLTRALLTAAALIAILGGTSGCGGQYPTNYTKPGDYSVTVTAKSGSTTSAITVNYYASGQ